MDKSSQRQMALTMLIRRVAAAEGCTGTESDLRSAVSKQVRLEFGVLFWLQVAWFVIPKLVSLFWGSTEGVAMRKQQVSAMFERKFAECYDTAIEELGDG
ncbi:hypothetical protein [Kordiimonas sp.]|uniref:hypothetical protein n=1 Tax=Kordiimonas sp. TaxID=1970157 RepID=UPI003A911715